MPSVLITLGSNIDKEYNLPKSMEALRQQPTITLVTVSPIYETAPVGHSSIQSTFTQPTFYNAAAWIETELAPAALRELLRTIEVTLGRVRTADKSAPRPIDLDIAFYGQAKLTLAGRQIPDPDVARFPHLALPLADIAPTWQHPESGRMLYQIADHLAHSETEIRKL